MNVTTSFHHSPRIGRHRLCIRNPEVSLQFYQQVLGMHLAGLDEPCGDSGMTQYHLCFDNSICNQDNSAHLKAPTLLTLIHRSGDPANQGRSGQKNMGYWKTGITVPDAELARNQLIKSNIAVTEASQFLDIGFLCHFADPDGYTIELLQHRFRENHRPSEPDNRYKLLCKPVFGQITLRIRDPEKSLDFYMRVLGMRLLSRQIVAPYRFTLYFLAYTDEQTPDADPDAVENREWLWQRPYTVLELQHIWGTETGDFSYETGDETGFVGFDIIPAEPQKTIELLRAGNIPVSQETTDSFWPVSSLQIQDPDGYSVGLLYEKNMPPQE